MNEILNLNNERTNDIQEISLIFQEDSKLKRTKAYFQDRQRLRQQKENWLTSTLKKNKTFTLQQKKQICKISVLIMNFHIKKQANPIFYPEDDIENNFIQTIINIFVDFINIQSQYLSPSSIKNIVRPNNNYVVMDLIKLLIDFCRTKFKEAIKQNSKYFNQYGTQINKLSNPRQKSKSVRYTQGNQPLQEDFQFPQVFSQQIIPQIANNKVNTTVNITFRKQPLSQINSHTQSVCALHSTFIENNIKEHLFQKNKRFLEQLNLQKIEERMNNLFVELVQLNQINSAQINEYYENSLGKKSKFNYDQKGLYSFQQKSQRKQAINQRLTTLKMENQVNSESSELDFKEYSKKYIESCILSEQLNKLEKKKVTPIMEWVALKAQYTNLKFQPITLLIVDDNEAYPWRKYRKNVPIKQFLKEKLKKYMENRERENQMGSKQKIVKKFRKQLFLDINKKKVHELLLMNQKIISKKQSLFPILRSTLQKQKSQGQSFQQKKVGSQSLLKNLLIEKQKSDRKYSQLPKKFEKLPTSSGKRIISNNIYNIHKVVNIESEIN